MAAAARHTFAASEMARPCGRTKRDGGKCKAWTIQEHNFEFCQHHARPLGTDTSEFRIDNLCNSRKSAVMNYRDKKDVYTKAPVQQSMELDHVVELHVIRDCYDQIKSHGKRSAFELKKKDLLDDLREYVNETENLNFTPATINQVKFKGVYAYLTLNVASTELGLVHYLRKAADTGIRGAEKLSRRETRRICKETALSAAHIGHLLNEEDDDTQLHSAMLDHFTEMITGMRLM
jgi:hypothetical protein